MRFTLGRLLRNSLVPKFFQVKESGEDVSYTPFAYANKFQPEMAAFLNSLTLKALFDTSRRDRCYITIETAPGVYKSPWDVAQEFVDRFVAQNRGINQVFKAKYFKYSDPITLTPLIFSCEFNPKMAKELIAGGADVNLSSGYTTPLRSAIERGDSELVKLLIAHKADVSSNMQPSGKPPLDFAVTSWRLQLIPILLEHQAKGSSNIVCLALYQTDMILDEAKDNKELLDCALKDSVKTLNVAKILILHVKYGFDTKSTFTALNKSIIIYHELNNVEKNRLGYSDIKEVMELASEILILMANSAKMTGEVVAKTADYSTSSEKPTINEAFTQLLQDHPCWSIYKKQADGSDNPLLMHLSQKAQELNKANSKRGIEFKQGVIKILENVQRTVSRLISPTFKV